MSGSVLCFAVTDGGQMFFLLGKQARPQSGRRTKISDTWCDFGGHDAPCDDNRVAHTAAREFWEESMCCVNICTNPRYDEPLLARSATLAHSLQSGNYEAAVTIDSHTCYLRQIPWDPAVPRTFYTMRKMLRKIRSASKKITWLVRRRPEGPRLHMTENWLLRLYGGSVNKNCKPTILSVRVHNHQGVQCVSVVFGDGTSVTREFAVESEGNDPPMPTVDDFENYSTYLRLTYEMQETHFQLTPTWKHHPSVKVTKWRGRVIRMTVNRHFLEMQCLSWWGLPALLELVHAMGRSTHDTIRPCFLPTIRIVLDYLAHTHKTHTPSFGVSLTMRERVREQVPKCELLSHEEKPSCKKRKKDGEIQ